MFGFIAKLTPKRLLAAACCVLLLIAALYAANGGIPKSFKGETAAQRVEFLQSFGWQCEINSEQKKSTVIPSEFDEVYKQYELLQGSQGFSLSGYKGRQAVIYSIKLTNYPDNPDSVFATLMVVNGMIIGGDIHSTAPDGFMHGFDMAGTGLAANKDGTNANSSS